MSHESLTVAEYSPSSDSASCTSIWHIGCSFWGIRQAHRRAGTSFLFSFGWASTQCLCFVLVLHFLFLPVSSGTCLLSHSSSLTLLRDSNLLLPWYYASFISICSAPFITVLTCSPHTDIFSLVFNMVQIIISYHIFPIQMNGFFFNFGKKKKKKKVYKYLHLYWKF